MSEEPNQPFGYTLADLGVRVVRGDIELHHPHECFDAVLMNAHSAMALDSNKIIYKTADGVFMVPLDRVTRVTFEGVKSHE